MQVAYFYLPYLIQSSQLIFKENSIIIPILPIKNQNILVRTQTSPNKMKYKRVKKKKSGFQITEMSRTGPKLSLESVTQNMSEPSGVGSSQLCGLLSSVG